MTGIEAPMHGELRFTLEKGAERPSAPCETGTPRVDTGGWYGATGVGPTLGCGSEDAVRGMRSTTSLRSTGSRAKTRTCCPAYVST